MILSAVQSADALAGSTTVTTGVVGRSSFALTYAEEEKNIPNPYLQSRLASILGILQQAHGGGSGVSSASKGLEREAFINLVLSNVISPPFRVGTGDITDSRGTCSGQVDIVLEYAVSMSFPLLRGDSARLYLAEGVCAVIEVKSDLAGQWQEVTTKAEKVASLRREMGGAATMGSIPQAVPYFVIGYRGWKSPETLERNLSEHAGCIDGVLDIDAAIYRSCKRDPIYDIKNRGSYGHGAEGPMALFGFLLSIEQLTSSMIASKPRYGDYT